MEKRIKLGPTFFVKLAFARYLKDRNDTFIIIYGKPRSGKTVLGFNFFIRYLKLARKLYEKGLIPFNPPTRWKKIFKTFFTVSAEDMIKKIKKLPDASPIFVDEALDFLSWHDALKKEQQDLIELIMKTGRKGMFTILITPSLKLLEKEILARAHYFFLLPKGFRNGVNRAYVLENYENSLLAEHNPFGIYTLIKKVVKKPALYSDMNRFIALAKSQQTFKGEFNFHFIDERLYNLYEKEVKEPLIMRNKERRRYVQKIMFDKLKYMFDTLLFNLHEKDGKTISQIETLLTDKFGKTLLTKQTISKYIAKMQMLNVRPNYGDFNEVLELNEDNEEIDKEEDLTLDEIIEAYPESDE